MHWEFQVMLNFLQLDKAKIPYWFFACGILMKGLLCLKLDISTLTLFCVLFTRLITGQNSFTGVFQQANSTLNCSATFYVLLLWKHNKTSHLKFINYLTLQELLQIPLKSKPAHSKVLEIIPTIPVFYSDWSKHQIHNARNTHWLPMKLKEILFIFSCIL